MKKLINDPDSFVDEVIDGLLLAHPGQLGRPPRTGARWSAPTRRLRGTWAS